MNVGTGNCDSVSASHWDLGAGDGHLGWTFWVFDQFKHCSAEATSISPHSPFYMEQA